jgi:hypothetical protein
MKCCRTTGNDLVEEIAGRLVDEIRCAIAEAAMAIEESKQEFLRHNVVVESTTC